MSLVLVSLFHDLETVISFILKLHLKFFTLEIFLNKQTMLDVMLNTVLEVRSCEYPSL